MLLVAEKVRSAEAAAEATFKKAHAAQGAEAMTTEQLQDLGWERLLAYSKAMDELYQTKGIEERAYFNGLWKMDM